jgi:hypothetical protein
MITLGQLIERASDRLLQRLRGETSSACSRALIHRLLGRGTISVEYDLLGDHLQENELMTGLAELARLADHHDDQLQQKLGGRRSFEA